MKTKCFRAFAALSLAVLLCIAMNFAAFLIDSDSMRENVHKAMVKFSAEGATPQLVGGYKSAQLDNFTAVLMIKTAAYNGPESLTHKAFGGLRLDLPGKEGQSAWDAFCTYTDNLENAYGGLAYARYWHGYTLPLRILFCLFDASNIQMLLCFAQLLLFTVVCLLAFRRCARALPGFLVAFFLLMPAATGTCLQYAPVTLLMLLACVLVLAADRQIEAAIGMPAYFVLTGLLTNYFDLLTFPLITLGFPLLFLVCLRLRSTDVSALQIAKEGVLCSIGWGVGFAGMWALKFLLCALCFGADYFALILSQMTLRVSTHSGGVDFSRWDAVRINLDIILFKAGYLAVLLLGAAASFAVSAGAFAVRIRRREAVKPDLRALLLLLPAIIPILWFMVMSNHSLDHTYYTYRNATVCFFALLACPAHLTALPSSKEKTP